MSRPRWRRTRRVLRLGVRLLVGVLGLTLLLSLWGTLRTRVERPARPPMVDDVTRLNPIVVSRIIAPTTTQEIVDAVRGHPGPIAVGGGRYSMGGQTATEGALQIDMRRFNRVLELSPERKTITVQAGIRWRQIQEHIDSAGLSVKIMQTYANFTVGGSLSVNVHGRYVGLGPLILSVRSLRLVLADGSVVEAGRSVNPEVFYGAIGGYGGLGVITEATLDLAENARVKRSDRVMPIEQYRQYFMERVRSSPAAVFHNADIYPDDYTVVNAVTYSATDDPVTVEHRLQPLDRSYRLNRLLFSVISEWPFGNGIRQHLVDPILFRGAPVSWRNYEASYDVAELEPSSRESSTYVLQEYFVPVDRFDEFVPRLRDVLRRHDVNVINVSIRHAREDPGALLAWARTEVFAFVLYYKQGTDVESRRRVGVWTRELIDAALDLGGSYYLPYQPHATEGQFLRAYPRAPEFFALKRRVDPSNKFRNRLWDKYYLPRVDPVAAELDSTARAQVARSPGYARDEAQSFLTHPEWYIVYSSDEYAAYLEHRHPTHFPYVASMGQYWTNYREVQALTRREYPFNWGYHVMLMVIGTSYSAELAVKWLYENTMGRFTGWLAGQGLTEEDWYAHLVAADYGKFIHVRPWYEYRFGSRLAGVWSEVPWWGKHAVRKWERKLVLSAEYAIKAVYATLIEGATRAAYTPQDDRMQLVVTGWSDRLAGRDPRITVLDPLDSLHTLIALPRYDGFREVVTGLARSGAPIEIREIAGNDEIFLTGVAPAGWTWTGADGTEEYALALPTDGSRKRFTMRVPVRGLLRVLRSLDGGVVTVDHLYDY